ncbi:hypothetical protein BSG1_15540 [Bacillus sp. SG-1]|nr:hypothetical protein BSG1_15540 [Bacillus sp. SG-1]
MPFSTLPSSLKTSYEEEGIVMTKICSWRMVVFWIDLFVSIDGLSEVADFYSYCATLWEEYYTKLILEKV